MELNWKAFGFVRMLVTPEMARLFLDRNINNRDIKPSVVDKYARDMRSGNWQFNGVPIQFDWNGVLIDGQHRLLALVEAGVALEFVIETGLDPASRTTIDIGATRDVYNAFQYAGEARLLPNGAVSKNTVAGVWARMKWGMRLVKGRETRMELIGFARAHAEAGLFAIAAFNRHKKMRSVSVAPVIAAVARASYHCDRARLERFVEVLVTGVSRTREEETILIWRESLLDNPQKNSNAQAELYGKTARTIVAFIRGEQISRIYLPVEDPYPLPETPTIDSRPDRVPRERGLFGKGGSGAAELVASSR